MKSNKGFTLIELLVVIAILGLLIAVLLPALRAAKIQAQMVVCLANMNGLSKAYHTYASDNDTKLVNGNVIRWINQGNGFDLTSISNYPPCWVDCPQDQTYHYQGEPAPDHPSLTEKQLGIMRGALFPYVGDVSGYRCPGDLSRALVPNDDNPYPENYSYRSYCISDLMNGYTSDVRMVKKMTEVVSPSQKFVFLETADSRGWIMGSWYFNTAGYAIDGLTIWHKKRSGFGFADGHAEMHTWTYDVIIDAATLGPTFRDYYTLQDHSQEDVQFLLRGYVPGRIK